MRKVLTPEQQAARAERQAKFRALWKQVADMGDTERAMMAAKYGFRTVEGKELSLCNQMLIALQLPQASVLGGFRQWIKQGRAVRKGEHGAMIWCPTGARNADGSPESPANGNETPQGEAADLRFIIGTVFDVSQTQELETSATTNT